MSTTYDPKDLTVTVKSVFLTGFSEDMVELEKDEDNWSVSVGAQGDIIRNKVNNPLATLTLTLQATSPQVSYLDSLAKSGELVPIFISYNGTPKETVTVAEAYIKKPAARAYGAEAEDRQYEIQCLDADFN